MIYGVVCPTGEVNLTDPDAQIAWHHAERANDDCPCGGRANSHVVRRMRDGRGPFWCIESECQDLVFADEDAAREHEREVHGHDD